LNVGLLDQRLPRGERDQWQGGGFGHVESLGLGGDVALVDGEVFGEGADAVLSGFGVHLVAGRESAHPRTGLNHDAGQVVAQHDRKLVARIPAHIHQIRAGREVTGHQPLVRSRCTF